MIGDEDFEDDELDVAEDAAPVVDDAGDPAAVRRRAKKLRYDKREAVDFWRAAFSTAAGRREMWNILQACHFTETKFSCGPNGFPQAEATWYALGEQSVGQRLFTSWLIMDRDGVLKMLDEHDPRFADKGAR